MTTRPYSECLESVLALCGIPDSNAEEVARVRTFINGRARKAYAASQYWPRWLKVEERICSEDGLVPYSEEGKDDIKTVLRVHATEPYGRVGASEYPNFVALASGVQITGYCPQEVSAEEYPAMLVDGDLNPDMAGRFPSNGTVTSLGVIYPFYQNSANSTYNLIPAPFDATTATWFLGLEDLSQGWASSEPANRPDDVTTWIAIGGVTGTPVVTEEVLYSAWLTYKAAFSTSYGNDSGHAGAGQEDDVPEEWFDYMLHGAYADFLRNDGQQEKAALAEAEAQPYLDEQLEQIDRQSGGHVFTRVVNHANTQWR